RRRACTKPPHQGCLPQLQLVIRSRSRMLDPRWLASSPVAIDCVRFRQPSGRSFASSRTVEHHVWLTSHVTLRGAIALRRLMPRNSRVPTPRPGGTVRHGDGSAETHAALLEIARAITDRTDVTHIAEIVVTEVRRLVPCDRSSVWRWPEQHSARPSAPLPGKKDGR